MKYPSELRCACQCTTRVIDPEYAVFVNIFAGRQHIIGGARPGNRRVYSPQIPIRGLKPNEPERLFYEQSNTMANIS